MGARKKDSVEFFLPKKRKARSAKSLYTMVRLDKHPELLEHLLQRVNKLGTDKQNFMIALLKKDMEEQNEK